MSNVVIGNRGRGDLMIGGTHVFPASYPPRFTFNGMEFLAYDAVVPAAEIHPTLRQYAHYRTERIQEGLSGYPELLGTASESLRTQSLEGSFARGGNQLLLGLQNRLLVSPDFGKTVARVPAQSGTAWQETGRIRNIAGNSQGVYLGINASNQVVWSTNNGASWSVLTGAPSVGNAISDRVCFVGNNRWFVGNNVWTYTGGGNGSWSTAPVTTAECIVTDEQGLVLAYSLGAALTGGTGTLPGARPIQYSRSDDYGVTWTGPFWVDGQPINTPRRNETLGYLPTAEQVLFLGNGRVLYIQHRRVSPEGGNTFSTFVIWLSENAGVTFKEMRLDFDGKPPFSESNASSTIFTTASNPFMFGAPIIRQNDGGVWSDQIVVTKLAAHVIDSNNLIYTAITGNNSFNASNSARTLRGYLHLDFANNKCYLNSGDSVGATAINELWPGWHVTNTAMGTIVQSTYLNSRRDPQTGELFVLTRRTGIITENEVQTGTVRSLAIELLRPVFGVGGTALVNGARQYIRIN